MSSGRGRGGRGGRGGRAPKKEPNQKADTEGVFDMSRIENEVNKLATREKRDPKRSRPKKNKQKTEGETRVLKDYTIDWLLTIGEYKDSNPVILTQMLDALRTNDSMEEPPRFPPPPFLLPAEMNTSQKANQMVFDPVVGKAVRKESRDIFRAYDVDVVQFMAMEQGYSPLAVHERSRVLCFERGAKDTRNYERVNVFYNVGLIGTSVGLVNRTKHPSQRFRRGRNGMGCTIQELQAVLVNPRDRESVGESDRPKRNSEVSSVTSANGSIVTQGQMSSFSGNSSNAPLSSLTNTSTTQSSVTSRFSSGSSLQHAFGDSGDESDSIMTGSESDTGSMDPETGNAVANDDGATSLHSTQARYIEIKIACYLTEIYRNIASASTKRSDWHLSADMWRKALYQLLDIVEFSDQFHEIRRMVASSKEGLTSDEMADALRAWEGHNQQDLNEVVSSVYVLYEHTAAERIASEKLVSSALKKAEAELLILNQDREKAVERAGGMGAWTTNRSERKGEHPGTLRRVDLIKSIRALKNVKSVLEQLDDQVGSRFSKSSR